jgi:hypothetical protein
MTPFSLRAAPLAYGEKRLIFSLEDADNGQQPTTREERHLPTAVLARDLTALFHGPKPITGIQSAASPAATPSRQPADSAFNSGGEELSVRFRTYRDTNRSRPMPVSAHDRHPVGLLISLADKKGYALAVSDMHDRWRLIGNDLRPAIAPDGGANFTSAEARAFLDAALDSRR